MWSNINRQKSNRRTVNIKGYLGGSGGIRGGFSSYSSTAEDDNDDINENMSLPSCDVSSLGGLSSLDTENNTTTVSTSNSHSSGTDRPPSILVEIPENFELDQGNDTSFSTEDIYSSVSRPSPKNEKIQRENLISDEEARVTRQKIAIMKQYWERKSKNKNSSKDKHDDSGAVAEIANNLHDMENSYMMSVYMNDDASIYTKTTSSETIFSSSSSLSSNNSISSTMSTRQRHRGAYHNRRRKASSKKRTGNSGGGAGNWIETMKESSNNFFVEDASIWTPSKGWQRKQKQGSWEPIPDTRWNDHIHFFDDQIKQERLEI